MKERGFEDRFDENVVEGVAGAGDQEKWIFEIRKRAGHLSKEGKDDQTKKCGDAQFD